MHFEISRAALCCSDFVFLHTVLFTGQAGSKDDREDLQAMDNKGKSVSQFPYINFKKVFLFEHQVCIINVIILNSIFSLFFLSSNSFLFPLPTWGWKLLTSQAILRTAEWVRSEAGMSLLLRPWSGWWCDGNINNYLFWFRNEMTTKRPKLYQTPKHWHRFWGMTRAYLLRACWRLHIPWLPEEPKEETAWTVCKTFHAVFQNIFDFILFSPFQVFTWFIHTPPCSSWFFHLFLI